MSSDDDIVAARDRAAKRPRQVVGVLEFSRWWANNESNRLYDVKLHEVYILLARDQRV
jgi:hypothetical protein